MGSNATLGCLPCQIEMLEYLIQHSPRWEEFAATTLTEELYPLLRDLSNQVPALRKVLLHWTAGSLVEVDILRRHDTISFTRRRTVLLATMSNAPWEVHQQLLSMNTTLVEAHIDVHPEEPDWTTIDGNIEMPQLRCLYVSHAELLAHLTVPNLEQLTLELVVNNIRRTRLRGAPGAHLTEQVLLRLPLLTELVILVYAPSDDDDSDSDGNLLELKQSRHRVATCSQQPSLIAPDYPAFTSHSKRQMRSIMNFCTTWSNPGWTAARRSKL
ncbi:hypothetical protein FB45DRAFT_1067712 [Roridomyces roridus]|uniref:Uncharacterized protein n=1 Tax=Roridomyces roridus TaxID=1738132 RepID=A0AAD7B1R7_9AGAR|nr:hypothetical protein FB45DRAFT_1067712 [Roridomyces roridus]